ncbi:sensor histidine kinase [Fulvivirga sediminis]|uniref:histidine kinase n=1 Tax=Fulvivirga sediminis TaxID=2803949 RepID=A0A937K050_9BACT|nr:sensor histidine kinase [Fulvivirga sediminis]MBL3658013.1 sensor histidine kinase [Fulvivirga sediminis]
MIVSIMEAYKVIKQYKETVIETWMNRVRDELPEANKHDSVALANDIPFFLDNLALVLEGVEKRGSHESLEHGKLRALFDNYSLLHVLREYRILKQVIFETLDAHCEQNVKDRNAVMDAFDVAIEQAGEMFFQVRNKIEAKAREQVEHDYNKLQDSDMLKLEFIEGLSHDMKNPITNIKLAVDLLRGKELAEEAESILNLLSKNADKTEVLINSLKNISFINNEEGFPVTLDQVNLTGRLQTFVKNNRVRADHQIELEVGEQIEGYWDIEALLRALDNLLENAIRYGDVSRPITIGAQQQAEFVIIFVHNYGKTIPFEEQAKIFSRLYQVNNSTGVGQGLGLATVKEIVEAHNGKVEISSLEQDGTTFKLVLPVDSRS